MATEILPPLDDTHKDDLFGADIAHVSLQIHNLHKHIAGIEANANAMIEQAKAGLMPLIESPQVQMLLAMTER